LIKIYGRVIIDKLGRILMLKRREWLVFLQSSL